MKFLMGADALIERPVCAGQHQVLCQGLALIGELQAVEGAQAVRGFQPPLLPVGKQTQGHLALLFPHQSRVGETGEPALPVLDGQALRHLGKIQVPYLGPFPLPAQGVKGGSGAAMPSALHQGAEIPALGHRFAGAVHQQAAHTQMGRQRIPGPAAALDAQTQLPVDQFFQLPVQRPFIGTQPTEEIRGRSGDGNELAADGLGQPLEQQGDFFQQQAGHQPF